MSNLPVSAKRHAQQQQLLPLVEAGQGDNGPRGPTTLQASDPTAKEGLLSVPFGRYRKITQISMDLPEKFKISFKDKSFENLDALIRVLGASDLMSLVDGSRLIPKAKTNNKNGYSRKAMVPSADPLSLNPNRVQ